MLLETETLGTMNQQGHQQKVVDLKEKKNIWCHLEKSEMVHGIKRYRSNHGNRSVVKCHEIPRTQK